MLKINFSDYVFLHEWVFCRFLASFFSSSDNFVHLFMAFLHQTVGVSTFSKGKNPLHQFPRSTSITRWRLPRNKSVT